MGLSPLVDTKIGTAPKSARSSRNEFRKQETTEAASPYFSVTCGLVIQARTTGIEPATFGSTVRRSNQLSYVPETQEANYTPFFPTNKRPSAPHRHNIPPTGRTTRCVIPSAKCNAPGRRRFCDLDLIAVWLLATEGRVESAGGTLLLRSDAVCGRFTPSIGCWSWAS